MFLGNVKSIFDGVSIVNGWLMLKQHSASHETRWAWPKVEPDQGCTDMGIG